MPSSANGGLDICWLPVMGHLTLANEYETLRPPAADEKAMPVPYIGEMRGNALVIPAKARPSGLLVDVGPCLFLRIICVECSVYSTHGYGLLRRSSLRHVAKRRGVVAVFFVLSPSSLNHAVE
jgi:hypothetical protein